MEEVLQECFKAMDGSHEDNIDNLTDYIIGYNNFCVDKVVPQKTVNCFPNNKSWETKHIKTTLNKKKWAFRNGDQEQLRLVQRELKTEIAEGKDSYRRKLKSKLQENNTKEVWNGLRAITGLKQKRCVGMDGDEEYANNLNLHFNRFEFPTSPAPTACLSLSFLAEDIRKGTVQSPSH